MDLRITWWNLFLVFAIFNCNSIISSQPLPSSKIDCHPLDGASKDACEKLGCVWSPVAHNQQPHPKAYGQALPFDEQLTKSLVSLTTTSAIAEPWCSFPADYVGYQVTETGSNYIKLHRQRPSGVAQDVSDILVKVDDHAGAILRVKIFDVNKARFEPEIPVMRTDKIQPKPKKQFNFEISQSGVLEIKRKSTGAVLFQTDLKKLIFTEKFIQLNSKLGSQFVYGLGEHYDTFLKSADSYKTYSFYNLDKLPLPGGSRSYGGFPFYINLDSDKKQAHGVYLRNSAAMDITLQPDQSITFRPIGGILDFWIFSGPSPNEVIQQYQNLVGLPDLPPRWSLGFHLCRYGYGTLDRTREIYQRTRDTKIPFDIQWNDIDNMHKHNDFTYDHERFQGLPEFVNNLHKTNMHYMLLFDPGLSQEDNYHPYQLGQEMDIWVKNATNQTLIGKVWNDSGRTVFPDFSNPKSIDYWTQLFKKFYKEFEFDGAWIDMNDISNFVDGSLDGCPVDNDQEQTPYRPGGQNLQSKTLCLSAQHKGGSELYMHNLYSFYEAIATYKALQATRINKRPFVISRSTTPGQGHYGGHWAGDTLATWDYLKWSIPSLIEHSMYGFSMMGSDICGFSGNSNPELCARWSTLGAFYTFSRNHNDDVSIDQDPVAMGPIVVEANRNALSKKYSLLPYLYSLIHRGHMYGEPIIRSVPFEFIGDDEALKVEYQFMWGKGLMISPVVEQNSNEKSTYLPKGRWYETCVRPACQEFVTPKKVDSSGQWLTTHHVLQEDIPLFYRGGFIFPTYPIVRQTIPETVNQPIGLEIALDSNNTATGELFMDEGDNVDGKYDHARMEFNGDQLNIVLDHADFEGKINFGPMKIFGLEKEVTGISANGKPISFHNQDHVLVLFDLDGMEITKNQPLVVKLTYG